MCGIAGILKGTDPGPPDETRLLGMMSLLEHRGPDECGTYVDDRIGLGHVRLSIIDLEGGIQPISNETGRLWIVFNGEVFNYPELREELLAKGHVFATKTDTEVILHLYEQEGLECFSRLNGQFALAIWDGRKEELILARDRMGIRPLFYAESNGQFVFASEIKALLLDPEVSRELDLKALAQIFTMWAPLTPRTPFRQVRAVPPGHLLLVQKGKVRTLPYWRLQCSFSGEVPFASSEEASEAIQELLNDAVRIRLRADVPVGCYLSGGLDSSLIAALVRKNFTNHLRTFSLGFASAQFDESSHQERMVRELQTEHSRISVSSTDILEHLPDVIWHCETPLLRTAPVPLFLLSRLIRDQGYKVVLTGEGADEVFAGYNIFKEAKVRHFWGRQPDSALRPLLLERIYPYVFSQPGRGRAFLQHFYRVEQGSLNHPFFSHQVRWQNCSRNLGFFSEEVLDCLQDYDPRHAIEQRLPVGFGNCNILTKAQYLEMDIFLSNYLLSSQGDRVAMANSLEIRLPFLDHRLVDLAGKLPPHWKLRGLNEKYLLKKLARHILPESIRNRTKQPYRAPIRDVFANRHTLPCPVQEALSDENLKKAGLFAPAKVAKLRAKYEQGFGDRGSEVQDMALIGILSTQLLHEQFVDGSRFGRGRELKAIRRVNNCQAGA